MSCCAAVRLRNGTSSGILFARANFFSSSKQRAVARLGPRLDRAFVERFAAVGNHQIDIEIDRISETLAARAGAVGIVERKQARLRLLIHGAARLALESLVEDQAFRRCRPRLRAQIRGSPLRVLRDSRSRRNRPAANAFRDRSRGGPRPRKPAARNRYRAAFPEKRIRGRGPPDKAAGNRAAATRRAPAGWPREKPWPAFLAARAARLPR